MACSMKWRFTFVDVFAVEKGRSARLHFLILAALPNLILTLRSSVVGKQAFTSFRKGDEVTGKHTLDCPVGCGPG